MRVLWRSALAIGVVGALYGGCFLLDLQPTRNTGWPVYLGLAFLAGLVGVGGELIAEHVTTGDRTSDPLRKRLPRLALLLLSAGAVFAALLAIARFM